MYVGIRLSELAVGEPLLSITWEHQKLIGKDAVILRLEEQFAYASQLGVKYIIDTIRTIKNSTKLAIDEGINGDIWTINERLDKYQELSTKYNINVVLEIDLAGIVTDDNVDSYYQFIVQNIIARHSWVKYWVIGVNIDEQYEDNSYKCRPELYHHILKNVYNDVKRFNKNILIGGPNVQTSLQEYINHRSGWLNVAIGNKFNKDSRYATVGPNGILNYIDFFAFPGDFSIDLTTIVSSIRTLMFEHLGPNNISIFQTKQGHSAEATDSLTLDSQAYLDIKELLLAAKYGIIPFKNELVDAYNDPQAWNTRYDSSRMNYGILQYSLLTKANFSTYSFVLNAIKDFDNVVKDSNIYAENDNIESITFQKEEETLLTNITVIWPKSLQSETVVLLPASYLREYQTQSGVRTVIHEPTAINLKSTHFILVYEKIEQFELDETDIKTNIERRLRYQREILDQMINELPSSFNREVMDTNIYRLMRVVSTELADASMQLTMIKEDGLIDTAREEAIYNNFGTLVKLEKRSDWTYSKYRKLVKGLLASFLKGPTTTSIATALQLFANFKVSIGELYKESVRNKYADIAANYNPQFTFIIELEKPVEDNSYTQEELMEETAYVLKMIKPAHTIGLLVLSLGGSDSWETYYNKRYNIDWHDMDDPGNEGFTADLFKIFSEGKFGWKSTDSVNNFIISPNNNNNGIYTTNSYINGGNFLGPRYTLFDNAYLHEEKTIDDYYHNNNLREELIRAIGVDAVEEYTQYQSKLLDISIKLMEPKFGFYHDKYMQLSGNSPAVKTINNYLLFGTGNSRLKDELIIKHNQYLHDKYVFSSFLKAIQFTTPNGINKRFGNESNDIIQWKTYLQEHPFTEKLQNGKVVSRITTNINIILDSYKEQFDKEIKEHEHRQTELTETAYISDDPSLQLNHLTNRRLGPNRREKVNISTSLTELYNTAEDYLPAYFTTYYSEKYEREIIDVTVSSMQIDCTETATNLVDNYLRLNIPVELANIKTAIESLPILQPFNNNGINGEQIVSILKKIAQSYNQIIDFNSPNIQNWINSLQSTQLTENIHLLRPFIRKNNEKINIDLLYKEKYKHINDKLLLFSSYLTDYYSFKTQDAYEKNILFNDQKIVHDRAEQYQENPLYFLSKNITNFSRFNSGYFISNKSVLTDVEVQGYKETFLPVNEINYNQQIFYWNDQTKGIKEYEQTKIVSTKEIYDKYQAVMPYVSLTGKIDVYNLPIREFITYNPYLTDKDEFVKKDEEFGKKLGYYEKSHIGEVKAFRLNVSTLNTAKLLRFFSPAPDFTTYKNDVYSRPIIDYSSLLFFYNDNYDDIIDYNKNHFHSSLKEKYEFIDEDKNFKLNHLPSTLISKRSQWYDLKLERNEERYYVEKETILSYICDRMINDHYKQVKELPIISTELEEKDIIYDDEKEATTFNSKLKKLIKKKAAIYTFNPIYHSIYDKNITELIEEKIENKSIEIYDRAIDLLITNTYFTDTFNIYNSNLNSIRLNRNNINNKFIKYSTELYNINVDTQEKIAIKNIVNNFITKYNNKYVEDYKVKNELAQFTATTMSDRFILYDDENVLQLNSLNNKRFIGHRTALYTFATGMLDKYLFNINDDEIDIYHNENGKEEYKVKNELAQFAATTMSDRFILYDDENALQLNGLNSKRFIGHRTALYTFSTEEFDKYDLSKLKEKENIYHDENKKEFYKVKNESLIDKKTTLIDKFMLYDDENTLHLNGLNSKRFIGHRTALYTFATGESDIYNFKKLKDKENIYHDENKKELYKVKDESLIDRKVAAINEHYYPFDEDNLEYLRLNVNKSHLHKLLGQFRLGVISLGTEKSEYFNKSLIKEIYNNVLQQLQFDAFNKVNDVALPNLILSDTFNIRKDNLRLNDLNNKSFIGENSEIMRLELLFNEIYKRIVKDSLFYWYKKEETEETYKTKEDKETKFIDTTFTEYFDISNEYLTLNGLNNKKFIGKLFDLVIYSVSLKDEYIKVKDAVISDSYWLINDTVNSYEDSFLYYLEKYNYEEYNLFKELIGSELATTLTDETKFDIKDNNLLMYNNQNKDKIKDIEEKENRILINKNEEIINFNTYKVFQFNKEFNQLTYAERDQMYPYLYINGKEYFNQIQEKFDKNINSFINEKFNNVKEGIDNSLYTYINETYSNVEEKIIPHLCKFTEDIYHDIRESFYKYYTEVNYYEKFNKPKVKQVEVLEELQDQYFNLNKDDRMLQFNSMRLNLSKFKINKNENYQANILRIDKYNKEKLVKEKEEARKIFIKDKMRKPLLQATEITPSTFTETIYHSSLNPFKFVSSQFNKKQFPYINIAENVLTQVESKETIKKPLLSLNNINLMLKENKMLTKEKGQITLRPFYNETYNKYVDYLSALIINKEDEENYSLLSTVAYMQLEKQINNKYVVVKKSSYV